MRTARDAFPRSAPVLLSGISCSSLACTRRCFYSGLDDSRVHRLRRSGMTFNKPRGRDTLSLAFESRIRVLPLNTIGDLYGPVEPPSHGLKLKRETSLPSPRGAEVSHGDAAAGQKGIADGEGEPEKEWRVLVVEPLEMWQVELPVPFPSPHPLLYAANGAGVLERKLLARHLLNAQEQAAPLLQLGGRGGEDETLDSLPEHADVTPPSVSADNDTYLHYRAENRRHLRQNGDTTLLPSSFQASFTRPSPSSSATITTTSSSSSSTQAAAAEGVMLHQQRVRFFLSVVADPFIDHDRFRREEAQVELISAYRNLFYEAYELPDRDTAATTTTHGAKGSGSNRLPRRAADVVRIPALSIYACGPRFFRDIGKLNQQSIIKGFHRISNEAKEQLILNKNFTVELYVPPMLLDQFETAFAEEAWEPPQSTLNPGRTALYPGLAPPRTLLTYDGWIGNRPELVEAIETEGRSLLRGPKYGLDGREIHEQEVLSHIRVFGSREEEARTLAAERETAAKQQQLLGERTPLPAGLRAGLMQDHEEEEEQQAAQARASAMKADGQPPEVR